MGYLKLGKVEILNAKFYNFFCSLDTKYLHFQKTQKTVLSLFIVNFLLSISLYKNNGCGKNNLVKIM